MERELSKLEKKIFITTLHDGLLEMFLGTMLFMSSISAWLEYHGISRHFCTVGILLLPLLYLAGKKFITIPRLGQVNFGRERRRRKKTLLIIILCAVILTFVVWLFSAAEILQSNAARSMQGYVTSLIIGLFLFSVFSLLAYFLDYSWLYLVALCFGVSEPLSVFLQKLLDAPYNNIIAFGVPALLIIISGIYFFVRFIRQYPRPNMEAVRNGTD